MDGRIPFLPFLNPFAAFRGSMQPRRTGSDLRPSSPPSHTPSIANSIDSPHSPHLLAPDLNYSNQSASVVPPHNVPPQFNFLELPSPILDPHNVFISASNDHYTYPFTSSLNFKDSQASQVPDVVPETQQLYSNIGLQEGTPASCAQEEDHAKDPRAGGKEVDGATSSRKRKHGEIWSDSQIQALIDMYEEKWLALNRENFKSKHWESIANELIILYCDTNFTAIQCRNKWENMKKYYIKEKNKENQTGGEPSRWEYFERFQELLSTTPKVRGLQGGFDGVEFANEDVAIAEDHDIVDNIGDKSTAPTTSTINNNNPPSNPIGEDVQESGTTTSIGTSVDGANVKGQRVKKKNKGALETFGEHVERSSNHFANVIKEVELRRIEAEVIRTNKALEVQLQIAQLLAQVRGDGSSR